MTTELRDIVRKRDNITDKEFDELVEQAIFWINEKEDIHNIMRDVFQIEPDYIHDLLEEIGKV